MTAQWWISKFFFFLHRPCLKTSIWESALCSVTHCHSLTLEGCEAQQHQTADSWQPWSTPLFFLFFFPFLSTFRQESPLEQCVMRQHHSFLLHKETISLRYTEFFFLQLVVSDRRVGSYAVLNLKNSVPSSSVAALSLLHFILYLMIWTDSWFLTYLFQLTCSYNPVHLASRNIRFHERHALSTSLHLWLVQSCYSE